MIRKVTTGLLAAVILSTATGCMPSPFAQDVPSTSWTEDEKGNKIKITNPGKGSSSDGTSGTESSASDADQIKSTMDSYYTAIASEEVVASMKNSMESSQSVKLSDDPAERQKQEAAMAKEALAYLKPVSDTMDTTGLTEVEVATVSMASVFVGGMGSSAVEIKIPDEIIIVSGDTASIDMSKADIYFEGEKTTSVAAKDGKSITHFVKKDGKWLINGKKLAESMGVEGSTMKLGISTGS